MRMNVWRFTLCRLTWAIVLVLASAGVANASPIYMRNPNLPIPDNTASGVTDELIVLDHFLITDLNVGLEIDHTFVGDLVITSRNVFTNTAVTILDRPGRTTSGNGCSSDDILVVLDDLAALAAELACALNPPAIGGTLSPNNPLSVFNGQDGFGQWRLNVSDRAGEDVGVLKSWTLDFNSAVPVPEPATILSTGIAIAGLISRRRLRSRH